MKLAVDTHTLIWYLSDSPRLSTTASDALDDAVENGGILVPMAVLFDLVYLTEKGRLPATDMQKVRNVITDTPRPVALASVTVTVMDRFADPEMAVLPDPWDRLMVATAQSEGLPLVTGDRGIRAAGIADTIW